GVYGLVSASGGGVGLMLGGALTSMVSWHWIFFVNVPIGAAVYALCRWCLPEPGVNAAVGRLDVWGAISVTGSLILATCAVVNAGESGWAAPKTLAPLLAALVLGVAFVIL